MAGRSKRAKEKDHIASFHHCHSLTGSFRLLSAYAEFDVYGRY